MARTQAREILEALSTLPPEKVAEVYDFHLFEGALRPTHSRGRERCLEQEDLHDLMQASLAHASQVDMLEKKRARRLH